MAPLRLASLASCDADLQALAEENPVDEHDGHPGAENAEIAHAALAEEFGNDSVAVLRNVTAYCRRAGQSDGGRSKCSACRLGRGRAQLLNRPVWY